MSLPPFQTVLDEHATALHRHVQALVGPNDADDVTQEVLVAALRAYPDLRDGSNLRGWLWTIARNKAIDRGRARTRRPRPVELPDVLAAGTNGQDAASAHEGRIDDGDGLWASVRRLPDGQRIAVTLRFVDDLSYKGIADLLGCSEGAARQRVHDGVRNLRQEVRP